MGNLNISNDRKDYMKQQLCIKRHRASYIGHHKKRSLLKPSNNNQLSAIWQKPKQCQQFYPIQSICPYQNQPMNRKGYHQYSYIRRKSFNQISQNRLSRHLQGRCSCHKFGQTQFNKYESDLQNKVALKNNQKNKTRRKKLQAQCFSKQPFLIDTGFTQGKFANTGLQSSCQNSVCIDFDLIEQLHLKKVSKFNQSIVATPGGDITGNLYEAVDICNEELTFCQTFYPVIACGSNILGYDALRQMNLEININSCVLHNRVDQEQNQFRLSSHLTLLDPNNHNW